MTARHVRLTPASEIQARPAPWPTYPHCPACKRRVAKGNAGLAFISCPHCKTWLGRTDL